MEEKPGAQRRQAWPTRSSNVESASSRELSTGFGLGHHR